MRSIPLDVSAPAAHNDNIVGFLEGVLGLCLIATWALAIGAWWL